MERILVNPVQVIVGIVVLLLGIADYLFCRPAWQFTLLPDFLFLQLSPNDMVGLIGGSLPSFLHVFGFSALSAGIIASSKKAYIVVCGLWAMTNIFFEMLQSDIFIALNEYNLYDKQFDPSVLEWLQNYSSNTVFDYFDVLAILLGAICAYWILRQTQKRELENGHVKT
jgi:hypothetical protein